VAVVPEGTGLLLETGKVAVGKEGFEGLARIGKGPAGEVFFAAVEGRGEPTGTSHRCPGCPCSGFMVAVTEEGTTVLELLMGTTALLGLLGLLPELPVGKVTWRFNTAGPEADFSLHEVVATRQKKTAE
jgi:hypothetical protein